MKFIVLTFLCLIAGGCAEVTYNGHKPKRVWYWSKEARVQRSISSELKQWQSTNNAIMTNLNQGIRETHGAPGK